MSIDDTTLAAFVDGELDPAEAPAVAAAVARDPDLAERVRILRETAWALGQAYGPIVSEPVPPALLAMIPPPARVHRPLAARPFLRMAAAVVLVVLSTGAGVFGGLRIAALSAARQARDERSEHAEIASLRQRALTTEPSGRLAAWRDAATGAVTTIEPLRTFKNREGQFCREFRETITLSGQVRSLRLGFACHFPDGSWRVRYYIVPGSDPPPALRQS